jgi:hypothetical protein
VRLPALKASHDGLLPTAPVEGGQYAAAPPATRGALPPLEHRPDSRSQGAKTMDAQTWQDDSRLSPPDFPQIEPEFRGRIHIGLDVMQYYSVYGHDARVKLFHCVRDPALNSPYALRVVSRDTIQQGAYYTFSASGVVQVFADDSTPEFTPIGEWMREQAVFTMMMQLSFFRNARAAKSFGLWRSNSRAQRMAAVKKRLEGVLFFAKPSFCSAVMEIHSQVYALTRTPLVELGDKTYELQSFNSEQAEVRRWGSATPPRRPMPACHNPRDVCESGNDPALYCDRHHMCTRWITPPRTCSPM